MSKKRERYQKGLAAIIGASFLPVATLVFFGPLFLFLTNADEFSIGLSAILAHQALFALILSVVFMLIFFMVPERIFQILLVLATACGFLFWMQGQVIVWQYGALDGQDIAWSKHFFKGILDGSIWIAVLALALAFRRRLFPWIGRIAMFFILLQAGVLLVLFLKNPQAWQPPPAPGIAKYRYDFSRDKNVLLLILDEFQSDVFAEIIRQDPKYSSMFDGFTYFRDAIGSFSSTAAAVPLIMTGQYYDNSERRSHYIRRSFEKHSIPQVLRADGFRLDLYPRPDANDLIHLPASWLEPEHSERISWSESLSMRAFLLDITLFRHVPHFAKPAIYRRQKWLFSAWARKAFSTADVPRPTGKVPDARERRTPIFRRELASLGLDFNFLNSFLFHAHDESAEPVFKYYHWNAVHPPLRFDEKFQVVYPEFNRSSYIRQARACLCMVGLVLKKMKDLNAYDRTLMIILSDHGSGRSRDLLVNPLANAHSRSLAKGNPYQDFHYVKSRACALLLVKPIRSRGALKTSLAPVSHLDIAPTIFSELKIKTSGFSGQSVFSIPEGSQRERYFYSYDWNGHHAEFLEPLVEYRIDGDGWSDASWNLTGRVLKAKK